MKCQTVDIYFSGMYNIYINDEYYTFFGSEYLEEYKIRPCGNADFHNAYFKLMLYIYKL